MKERMGILSALLAVILIMLACQSPLGTPTQNTDVQQTQTSLASTLDAVNNTPPTETMEPTETEASEPTETPTEEGPTSSDVQLKINTANILVYEDSVGVGGTLRIVTQALKNFQSNIVNVGDAVGTFMQNMEAPHKWDLIIVASEFRDSIRGEIWTAVQKHVDNDPSALITELYYMNKINEYDIKPFMNECGITYQKDWRRGGGFNQIDYEIYWTQPDSTVFKTPNVVERFSYPIRNAKAGDVGDFVQLTDGSNATILASHYADATTDRGLLTSCIKGTMLVQTFRSHDYPSDPMIYLWQNYITYVLTNHFMNTP